jgi:glyoxylate reductase
MDREDVLRADRGIEGLLSQGELTIDAELLDTFPNLRIVANAAVGTDNLRVDLMSARGVWATYAPDSLIEPTADVTLGLILCLARRIVEAHNFVLEGRWRGIFAGYWNGPLLAGKTLGLLGYGRIAQAVAVRAKGFGMRVIHHRRTTTEAPDSRSLGALLEESDFLSIHTPLTPETRHLLNADRLSLMRPGAYLINTGRGPIVDEEALVEALGKGHLAGAALDVFENEPEIHPGLLKADNVVLTPHIGGAATEGRCGAQLTCTENIAAVFNGERPQFALKSPGD